jgi:RNA polymerase primary sigma factor
LISAVDKYDPNSGFKFFSYGVWWIRKSIIEYLMKNGRLIRLPQNKLSDIGVINKKLEILEQKYSREVCINELFFDNDIMKELDLDENDLSVISTNMLTSIDSLDASVGNSDDNSTLQELISTDFFKPTDYLVNDSEGKLNIDLILKKLVKERDRNIIIDYLGLNGDEPMNLREIGEKYGVSKEMIRQIKDKSLRILKYRLIRNI